MTLRSYARLAFWCLTAAVLYLALAPNPWDIGLGSDTSRHYLAFLVMPAFAAYAWPRMALPMMWLIFVAFGGGIELLQLTMHMGRVAEWRDWFNDIVATTASLAIHAAAWRRKENTLLR